MSISRGIGVNLSRIDILSSELGMVYEEKLDANLGADSRKEYGYELTEEPTQELLDAMSELYSAHYGVWDISDSIHIPGERIKLSAARIKKYVDSGRALVVCAYQQSNNSLIGYVIAVLLESSNFEGTITWVTQLVVHQDHRHKGVGRNLLHSVWGFSDHQVWGLLSSSPYAVRALEKATRRRCVPVRIRESWAQIMAIGCECVPYINEDIEVQIDEQNSKVNTEFRVDTSELMKMIENVSTEDAPWLLGLLEPGWEWVAFTFQDQKPIPLSSDEIKEMLETSDQATRKAYSRMNLNREHVWTRYTDHEVDQVIKYCKLKPGMTVLDLGCGVGRHSTSLALRDFGVTAVDYNSPHPETPLMQPQLNLKFIEGDCRTLDLSNEFDAVICLYDVIGSYVEESENCKLLGSIFRHLKPGGYALISVMNYELTRNIARRFFSLSSNPDELSSLPASDIMQNTGNIFDPNLYMIDTDTSIVYRKEQFTSRNDLPVERIIRDKRFYQDEIRRLCESVGLEVEWSKFVRLGYWDAQSLSPTDEKAKEILLLCRKPNM